MSKATVPVFVAGVAVGIHLDRISQHKRTCPTCPNRDYADLALDFAHLYGIN